MFGARRYCAIGFTADGSDLAEFSSRMLFFAQIYGRYERPFLIVENLRKILRELDPVQFLVFGLRPTVLSAQARPAGIRTKDEDTEA